jgi:hypothetical protein
LAKLVGNSIPKEISTKIKQQQKLNSEVIFLLSTDPEGYPHVSLLSFLDIVILSPRRILFAIGKLSTTRSNLLRTRKGTLILWGGSDQGMFYIKGDIAQVVSKIEKTTEGFELGGLLMDVQKVSQDNSVASPLLTTLTFDHSGIDSDQRGLHRELLRISQSLKRKRPNRKD